MYIFNILIEMLHIIIQKPSQLLHGIQIFLDLSILSLELVDLSNLCIQHGFLPNFVLLLLWNVDPVKIRGSYVIHEIICGGVMGFVEMLQLIEGRILDEF